MQATCNKLIIAQDVPYLLIQQEIHRRERPVREDSSVVALIQAPQAFLLNNRAESIDTALVSTLESVRLYLQALLDDIHGHKDRTTAKKQEEYKSA